MGVFVQVLLLAGVVALSNAVRLPYLGGDIDDFIQSSKQKDMSDPSAAWIVANQQPVEPKPITQKQKRDSTNYNSKFTDIARAYAEGYKAAIKAVQQRALIARKRLHGIKPFASALPLRTPSPALPSFQLPPPMFARSNIPHVPAAAAAAPLVPKSTIPSPAAAAAAVPNDVIPGVGESAPVISPGPSSDHETQTLPTLNGLPDSAPVREEMVARSTIPQAPVAPAPKEEKKSEIPGLFASAISAQTTENAVEKSWIPGAENSDSPLNMNERSTKVEMPKIQQEKHVAFPEVSVHMRSQEDRDRIARLNARARHRNIYFDGAGGDPFNGGGVLSVQNAVSLTKKHRRRRRRSAEEKDDWYFVPNPHYLRRNRRSHMPYLGQNLDAMGVVRATPKSWTSAQVRKSIADAKAKQQILAEPAVAYNQPEMSASPFTQSMPAAFRAEIPQPPQLMMPGPMAYGGLFTPQPRPQFPGYRSMIPNYPAFFNQMPGPFGFPMQAPVQSAAGMMGDEAPSVETPKPLESLREKKSTIQLPGDMDQQPLETVNFNV